MYCRSQAKVDRYWKKAGRVAAEMQREVKFDIAELVLAFQGR
jgi:hypothetical protein